MEEIKSHLIHNSLIMVKVVSAVKCREVQRKEKGGGASSTYNKCRTE